MQAAFRYMRQIHQQELTRVLSALHIILSYKGYAFLAGYRMPHV